MSVRGIRGATTVGENRPEDIFAATRELMEELVQQNEIKPEHVAAVFITVTTDLDADFPAKALRTVEGWGLVPLMCSTEIPVPGSLMRCVRLMMLVNTEVEYDQVKHVFLHGAQKLRPDLLK